MSPASPLRVSMSDTARDITVTVQIVCPHCNERFPMRSEASIDAAREHVDAHTIYGDEACADGG